MSTTSTPNTDTAPTPSAHPSEPIALGPDEGEARWFLGTLVTIKSSTESTAGRVAVLENYGARGSGSPLHVHCNEDEWFYVTEGELTPAPTAPPDMAPMLALAGEYGIEIRGTAPDRRPRPRRCGKRNQSSNPLGGRDPAAVPGP
jgi:hypothetical protein